MPTTKEIEYIINEETGCWECTSHKPDSHGYAIISINKKRLKIHRHMFELYKGEIPAGLLIRHTCDNRICINPNHLIAGTQQDNIRDSIERGRHIKFRTTSISKRAHRRNVMGNTGKPIKLTAQQVMEIRQSNIGGSELARLYNVCRRTIWEIRQRITWKLI